jgi:hypothetical protein
MKPATAAVWAVGISLALRIALIALAPAAGLEAHQAIIQADHIKETGLPLGEDNLIWQGGHHSKSPLGHYIIAVLSILMPTEAAALLATNLALALLPITVMLLASDVTKKKNAIVIATLASPFIPLLYTNTLKAPVYAFGIPLFLLALHLLIRIAHTPKEQTRLAVILVLLAFTHPLGLLLAAGMGLSLILLRVQKTRYSHALAEATVFTALLMVWANAIIYRAAIHNQGAGALWKANPPPVYDAITIGASIGPLVLLAGGWAAVTYLRKEKNTAAHMLLATLTVTLLATALRLIAFEQAAIISAAILLALSAASIELAGEARARSRVPSMYTIAIAFAALLFIATNVTPAIANGVLASQEVPGDEERAVRQTLMMLGSQKTLWEPQYGAYIRAAQIPTATYPDPLTARESEKILEDLNTIREAKSHIPIIETLNRHEVKAVVLRKNHSLPLSERCFEPFHLGEWEVYELRCIVQ